MECYSELRTRPCQEVVSSQPRSNYTGILPTLIGPRDGTQGVQSAPQEEVEGFNSAACDLVTRLVQPRGTFMCSDVSRLGRSVVVFVCLLNLTG